MAPSGRPVTAGPAAHFAPVEGLCGRRPLLPNIPARGAFCECGTAGFDGGSGKRFGRGWSRGVLEVARRASYRVEGAYGNMDMGP